MEETKETMILPTEHFVLKENGLIYWIDRYPYEPDFTGLPSELYENYCEEYQRALQSAIDNAVEVSNQEEVLPKLFADNKHKINASYGEWIGQAEGKVYSLQCRVEITAIECTENDCACRSHDYCRMRKRRALVAF